MTAQQMAEKLRLTPRLAKQLKLKHVTDAEARTQLGLPAGFKQPTDPRDYSGIAFAGFDLAGNPRGTYQVRRDRPDQEKGKEVGKWMSAGGSENRYINTSPGKLHAGELVIRVESVKSVWAILASAERLKRRNIRVIDSNGLDGWLVREAGAPSHPNPDLLLLEGHHVIDVPDSDAVRSDLALKVERFQSYLLETVGVASLRTVRVPTGPDGKKLGPDDYLAKYGDEAFWALVDAARASWQEAAPPLSDFVDYEIAAEMLIPHIIAANALTVFAAPSENYKTLAAFHVGLALLTKKPLFEHFKVEKPAPYVFYNVPDMSFEMVLLYGRALGLDKAPGFHVRSPKQGGILQPDDPIMKAAARDGAYFVFDTMAYFLEEDLNPQVITAFTTKCRHLIGLGSAGVLLLAHPTKQGAKSDTIELTEWVSGTYQKIGTVDAVFCLKALPLSDTIARPYAVYVERTKSRAFLGVKLDPFTLGLNGKDGLGGYLKEGRLPVESKPGETPALKQLMGGLKSKGGHPTDPEKDKKLEWLEKHLADQKGKRPACGELARRLNRAFDANHDRKTVGRWLKEISSERKSIEQI